MAGRSRDARSPFASEYEAAARQTVRPRGREFDLVIPPRYRQHYVVEAYEALTADLLGSLLRSRRLFVDVGAHCGFFTLLAATVNPELRAVALEPVMETHRLLCEGIARNRVGGRVEAVCAAAAATAGDGRLFISEASDNCSFYPHPSTATLGSRQVPTLALDTLLKGRPDVDTAVVKVDTDGHELSVLAGMRDLLASAPDLRLVVELNPKMQRSAGHAPEDLVAALLAEHAVFLIDDRHRRFLRLARADDWRRGCADASYANLYCVRRPRALSVAVFAHSSGLAGAERSLLSNVTALVEDHGAVCTAVLPGDGPLGERLGRLGVATVVFPAGHWWCDPQPVGEHEAQSRMSATARALVEAVLPPVAAAGPDVIESMTLVSPWGAVAAAVLDLPHVWQVCEYGERDHGLRFFAPFAEISRAIADHAELVLPVNDDIRDTLFPAVPDARCQVIGRWFPGPPVPAGDAAEPAPRSRRALGVFASTLSEGKGPLTVLRALRELVAAGHDVELVLAGQAALPYHERLVDAVREWRLHDRVRFLGFVEDVAPFVRAVDVVICAAPDEAFGRSAYEAALLDRPVLLARGNGPSKVFRDGIEAVWFTAGDAADLAAKAAGLLDDAGYRRTLAAAARRRVARECERARISGRRHDLLMALRGSPHAVGRDPVAALVARTAAALLDETRRLGGEGEPRPREELAERDRAVASLQASLTEQTRWAQASAAEVARRDAIIAELQASLTEQMRWAQASAAGVARRDAIIAELQASLTEQTRSPTEPAS